MPADPCNTDHFHPLLVEHHDLLGASKQRHWVWLKILRQRKKRLNYLNLITQNSSLPVCSDTPGKGWSKGKDSWQQKDWKTVVLHQQIDVLIPLERKAGSGIKKHTLPVSVVHLQSSIWMCLKHFCTVDKWNLFQWVGGLTLNFFTIRISTIACHKLRQTALAEILGPI